MSVSGIMESIKGWSWSTWTIIGLVILSVILFIVVLSLRAKKNELEAKIKTTTTTTTTGAASYKRRQPYMPDPGIPAKNLLYGRESTMGNATAGFAPASRAAYKTGADPDRVLKGALMD
ncbi:MAG: hypothetical protein WC483_01085 [Candidatus Paceibacterota bacterium]